MAKLSLRDNSLNLTLEESERTSRLTKFLTNTLHLRERDGNFISNRKNIEFILTIRQYCEENCNVNVELDDDELRQRLDEHERIEAEYNLSVQKATEIKNTRDEEIQNITIPEFKGENLLLQYQIKPVMHGVALKNSANFSVPGAGKTWMAYATYFLAKHGMELPAIDRLLVICPISAMQVWEEEYEEITGNNYEDKCIRITKEHLDGTIIPDLPRKKEIVLINYDKLGGVNKEQFLAALKIMTANYRFYIILDESHKIKNYNGATGESVRSLAEDHEGRRMILTGTPMPNYLEGLWNQFYFLFPKRRLIGPYEQFHSSVRRNRAQELRVNDQLRSYFIRVNDMQLNLPEATQPLTISCEMERVQEEIVETISWRLAADELENAPKFTAYGRWEKNRMYLIMALTDPSLLSNHHEWTQDVIDLRGVRLNDRVRQYYRNRTRPGKITALKKLLEIELTARPNEKILIWCNFRGTVQKSKT